LSEFPLGLNGRAALCCRAGKAATALRPLTQPTGAGFQDICQLLACGASTVAHARADVGELVASRSDRIARAVSQVRRIADRAAEIECFLTSAVRAALLWRAVVALALHGFLRG